MIANLSVVVVDSDGGARKSVLYDGTRALFERAGFAYVRSKGPGNCVMRRTVP